jgi:hypothetical protein
MGDWLGGLKKLDGNNLMGAYYALMMIGKVKGVVVSMWGENEDLRGNKFSKFDGSLGGYFKDIKIDNGEIGGRCVGVGQILLVDEEAYDAVWTQFVYRFKAEGSWDFEDKNLSVGFGGAGGEGSENQTKVKTELMIKFPMTRDDSYEFVLYNVINGSFNKNFGKKWKERDRMPMEPFEN